MAKLNYYVLVSNHTQAMKIQETLREGEVPSRISPTPHAIQGVVGCGVSILLKPEDLEDAKRCLAENDIAYHSIVPLECRIDPHRIPHV